jgi:hypothetical protein
MFNKGVFQVTVENFKDNSGFVQVNAGDFLKIIEECSRFVQGIL